MNKNDKYFQITDLKLQAFLRCVGPEFYRGVNQTNGGKTIFLFENCDEVDGFIRGYLEGEEYEFSPGAFASYIDYGKQEVFKNRS